MSIAKRHNKLRGLIKAGKFFVHAIEVYAEAWEPLVTPEERLELQPIPSMPFIMGMISRTTG